MWILMKHHHNLIVFHLDCVVLLQVIAFFIIPLLYFLLLCHMYPQLRALQPSGLSYTCGCLGYPI